MCRTMMQSDLLLLENLRNRPLVFESVTRGNLLSLTYGG